MISLPSILAAAVIIFVFAKILDFTYLFQTKEYRFDRFLSFVKEEGIFHILYTRRIRLPAKTPRNFLILLFAAAASILIFPFLLTLSVPLLLVRLFLSPVSALFFTALLVLATAIPARIRRKQIIQKADKLVKKSNAVFIGITGSYGKTTTKEFLAHILSAKYRVGKTEANLNTDIGIAISVLKNLKPDTQFFVAEIGAYKKGEIAKACKIIKPKFAIITAIGNQHLDLFGSKKNLILAKKELLDVLPKEGRA
ncbi:hypothetical protein HYT33_02890, partial [Candidatus Roizmanbacteria bacterium]|nr:hypothetical protein [Candidatus Roizmanbacteria bacterium]